ncbi:class I SAM-dependent methyltransferase [Leptolyngbya sp. KIOST-1]|uniref:class I SAM-dependent methyltransferase n=1 Tax=Leptolyngbya sp. KIOST-1 TaxID=1229172 RepID=UPI0005675E93|nr:class I SAM-dependent methyltransferase [Leptolyngbya sp. KIOST-1]
MFNSNDRFLGSYNSLDGTVEFYGRIKSLLQPDFKVLDYGAGRGQWFFEDASKYRRSLRDLKTDVKEFIGVDVSPVVLTNPITSRNLHQEQPHGSLPLEAESIDIIICDYVLEHLSVADLEFLRREAQRLLKPGGFFCARTPHYWNCVCVGARLVRQSLHSGALRLFQPERKPEDIFPTQYRCNTHRQVSQWFAGWSNYSYTYVPEPGYCMGNRYVFALLSLVHRLAPSGLTGNLFVFLQKP